MKELLAVSWEMPPLSGPRAVQVSRTLCELVPLGWRSRVVCFSPRSNRYNQDFNKSVERDSGGAVTRIGVRSPEERFFFRALWRICPPIKVLPDEKRVWIPGAVSAARRAMEEVRPDLIVSFAQPWSDHLIGLRLHEESGVPWVAHFSDPWVDSPYLPYVNAMAWQRRLWRRMEEKVLSKAARVVFVSRYAADRVMENYPKEWSARVRVVPQGYDGCDQVQAVPAEAGKGPLRLAYTGRFYDDARTPETLMKAVAAVNRCTPLEGRLVIDFVGGAMGRYERLAARLGLERIIVFRGRRSPVDARAVAATADVLLSIDAPSDGPSLYLPSKLIDYLPLRRPILGLTPREGASADLLRRLGYAVLDPEDAPAIASEIERLLDLHAHGALGPSEHHDEVAATYHIRQTSRAFHAVMEEALNAR
jgi:glycosyltransferase involved in cell wall biosynthesis